MPYSTVIYTKKDHIGSITLNRPQAGNSINLKMAEELEALCLKINQDDDIYVVTITGAGDKAFCNGSELEKSGTRYSVARAIASIQKPVIAAINGDALGPGLELALSVISGYPRIRRSLASPRSLRGLSLLMAAPSACRASWGEAKPWS